MSPLADELTADQRASLGQLRLFARWTPPDGDCWFDSVIRAAQDVPNRQRPRDVSLIARLNVMQLRARLLQLFNRDDAIHRDLGGAGVRR